MQTLDSEIAAVDPTAHVPLCVDLDGTLVKSDTLVDSTLALARYNPALLLRLPSWLLQGKAALKQHITSAVELDVVHLPYNQPLLDFLREQHALGRPLYLATAADAALAHRVADHLGLFAGVLASDGATNLAGSNKLAAFRLRFGDRFCYIGNASPDIALLSGCVDPMTANPTRGLSGGLRAGHITPTRTFVDRSSPLKAWLKAIRLHQWAKNVLIFLPLLLAHVRSLGLLAGAVVAFLSFGLCASATYIINDLLDIEADRAHPRKRRRPFAAGDLSALSGIAVVLGFFLASLLLALAVPRVVAALSPALALPAPPTPSSSGSSSTPPPPSLTRCVSSAPSSSTSSSSPASTPSASSPAPPPPASPSPPGSPASPSSSSSRSPSSNASAELENLLKRGGAIPKGRGYHVDDIEQLRSFGSASAYASVVVFTLYISNLSNATELYHHSTRLWLLVPVLLLWLSRLWLLASRGNLHEDPVVYAITDKRSLALGAIVVAIVLAAL